MQFLFPWFLWALAALAVPVIIHLFNFRRFKTVYFSNVKFLREVKEETSNRSKVKHLLVLASRLLAVLFLVFAFAQPFIPGKKQEGSSGRKTVSIYIDNSFSMNAVNGGKSLFEKARLTAREIARNYSADDQFQLLTNDFEGRHQRLVSKDEFITMLDELEISPAVRSLNEVLQRQKDALSRENAGAKIVYVLSDYQKNMGGISPDSSYSYNLIPLAADAQSNIYIDTCWLNEPVQLINQPVNLIVKVRNSGEKTSENNRLVLKLNGQTKSMAELNIEPGAFVYDTLSFVASQSGWNKAELAVSDYPITYDDNYYVTFNVIDKLNVLAISENRSNSFLDALFKNQPEFEYTSTLAATVQPDLLKGKQLIVFDNLKSISPALTAAANSYLTEGGAIVVFPGEKCEMEAYNRFLNNLQANSITGFSEQTQDLAGINLQQNVFRDVFERIPENMNLPQVRRFYTFASTTASRQESILTLRDGNVFLSRYPAQTGSLYVCASPLEKAASDLPVHAIFVPMLYKMAVLSVPTSGIAYFIGDKTRIEMEAPKTSGEHVYKIKGDNLELVPEQFTAGNKILLGLSGQVKKAGFYSLSLEGAGTAEPLALNFDRRESDLEFYTAADLRKQYEGANINIVDGAKAEVAAVVKELDRGTPLWKLCLILTLVFLATETALLRFWKT